MKNWEYWEKELRMIGNFDFAVVDGMVKSCSGTCCDDCKFGNSCNCNDGRLTWLYSDKEPTLTQEEKTFVDTLKDGYIVRDKDLTLSLFPTKPKTYLSIWVNVIKNNDDDLVVDRHCVPIDWKKFQFIKWMDEPWSVEDLKKLKVKE